MLSFGLVIPVFAFLFESDAHFSSIYDSAELKLYYLMMVGSFSVGALLGAPAVGAFSDRLGRKPMLFFTYITQAFFYLLFVYGILTLNFWCLLASRFLGGLMGGALLVVQSAIADVSAPEDKAKNFGITGIAFGLGFIIGSALGATLSDSNLSPYFGYTLPFYVSIVVTTINVVFLAFAFRETNWYKNPSKISIWVGPKNILKAFTTKSLRDIFIVIFLITFSFNFLIQLFQLYVREVLGFSKTNTGLFLAFVGISVAVAQGLILPYFSKRMKPRKLMLLFLPIFAITYLALLVPKSQLLVLIPTFILVVCQGITFPTTLALVSNQASAELQGETIGINQAVQSAAAACPIVLAAFVEIQYDSPMYIGAALTALAWLYFLWAFRK